MRNRLAFIFLIPLLLLASSIKDGINTVAAAGTAEALSASETVVWVTVQAEPDNIAYANVENFKEYRVDSTVENNSFDGTDPSFLQDGVSFILLTGSLAIDAGMDASAVLTDDYIGTSRPQGDDFDIGAYEHVP